MCAQRDQRSAADRRLAWPLTTPFSRVRWQTPSSLSGSIHRRSLYLICYPDPDLRAGSQERSWPGDLEAATGAGRWRNSICSQISTAVASDSILFIHLLQRVTYSFSHISFYSVLRGNLTLHDLERMEIETYPSYGLLHAARGFLYTVFRPAESDGTSPAGANKCQDRQDYLEAN